MSPGAITNAEFTNSLARAVHRPAFLAVPAFAVKLLFGAMGPGALLASARVQPARLLDNGFAFRFAELDATLRHLLNTSH